MIRASLLAKLSVPTVVATLLAAATPICLAQQLNARSAQADTEDISQHEGKMVEAVRAQLIAEQFDEIDHLADQLRRDKSRWTGGGWKLHSLYEALDSPELTDKDTVEHLDHLKRWMSKRPEDITPRIALATSLHRWAWVARGNGLGNTVSPEAARLFHERIAEAEVILQSSQKLALDPQFYSEEMIVGLAQGWDGSRMEDLYRRAVQFEPEYLIYYTQRANYLLPKWYGEPADATSFAREAADHLGGDRGDLLYFDVSTAILHRGNGNLDPFVKAMDWNRIQHGYLAMSSTYGLTRRQHNQLAFMAFKYNDHAVAQREFAIIGTDWAPAVWKDRAFFDRIRDWSTGRTQWP